VVYPSGLLMTGAPTMQLTQGLNTTLVSWNATTAVFTVYFSILPPPGTQLTLNLTGPNQAPRSALTNLQFMISLNTLTGVTLQTCSSLPLVMSPSPFPSSLVQAKTPVTTQPTDLLVSFTSLQIATNDTLMLTIPASFPFNASVPVTCFATLLLPCVASTSAVVVQLTALAGQTNVTVSIQGGFTNPLSNVTIPGFQLYLIAAGNYLVHQ